MELRQLEYFIEVSQQKSYTHAAMKLHVSQPSITNSINKLEEELGVKLLDRNTKKVDLTSQGKVFYDRTLEIWSLMQEAIYEVQQRANKNIRLGLPPMIGATFFPKVFFAFHQIFPHIHVEVVEKGSEYTLDMLEKERLDLGFIILPERSEILETRPLIDAQLMVCMAKDHKLSRKKSIDWRQIADEPFVMLSEEFSHCRIVMEECRKRGIQPNVIVNSEKMETVKNMVASGLGISILMDQYIKGNKEIKAIPLQQKIPIRIGLAWPKEKKMSRGCREYIDFSTNFFSENASQQAL